jgi:glycosyltransferase involved in cell wall biosynthesis
MHAVIVIPAHNEAAVIKRTLETLLNGLSDQTRVIVACNGCTDATAEIARSFGERVEVHDIPESSKIAAINHAEDGLEDFPRLYQDADVLLSGESAEKLIALLRKPGVVSAEPIARYDTSNCSFLARVFYRVWTALHCQDVGRIGCGVYSLTRESRARFGAFPPIIADDGYVRAHLGPDEIRQVDDASTVVFGPRTIRALIRAKARVRIGVNELQQQFPELWSGRERVSQPFMSKVFRLSPLIWPQLPIYAVIQFAIRRRASALSGTAQAKVWSRDDSRPVA